ncbi:zinc ribbon domain protein [Halobacteriovorax sp. BALOs_7]|uniref:zinc ribbon domain-containing protein n=1 Tax=Halobacteriovorax sp. BALOs_7 TaxID=2109558 RepID=UPI000EA29645|nr:hypothetical protein [Halobacteriovorax sp. BALOs_7]AYF45799.1 zinc ribbon domain protein [Halobacteriovorax sp. BALOs_7]
MENLKYLKDVMSLDKVILGLKQANNEELKRIEFLIKQKDKKEEEIAQLRNDTKQAKEQVTANEKSIFEIEKKLEQSRANLNAVTSQQQEEALSVSIKKQEDEFEGLQDKTLELLEMIEEKEALQKEAIEFITGITNTIDEIQAEVDQGNKANESKVLSLENQIEGLLSEVPPEAVKLYKMAASKRAHDACTFLIGQSCGSCKFTYAAGEVATFNKGIDLILCKGCQRLLLPAPLRDI